MYSGRSCRSAEKGVSKPSAGVIAAFRAGSGQGAATRLSRMPGAALRADLWF